VGVMAIHFFMSITTKADVWKGAAAGLLGGLVASWTMNRFQDIWLKISEDNGQSAGPKSAEQVEREKGLLAKSNNAEQEDTTVRAASAISEGIFDHELTEAEKKIAGPAVHYALGTGVGALYGMAAEVAPEVTMGTGLPFGAAFWLVVDETAVPAFGLSKPPTEYSVSTHVYALASHLVYGLTAEIVRRTLRRAL
jgi:putative membrane protein